MNKEIIPNLEQKEKYGENVEIHVYLLRHAEKQTSKDLAQTVGAKALLSEKGEAKAIKFGEELKKKYPEFKGIKIYHSGIDRAEKTGGLIAGKDTVYVPRKRDSLALQGKITQEVFNKVVDEAKAEGGGEVAAIQKLLDAEDKPLDENSMTSKEIGKTVAANILRMVEMSKRLYSDSKVNTVFVSHAGVIEHFLADLLNKKRAGFMEDYLGELQYLEGPEFFIKRENKDKVSLQIKFRDEEFLLSEEELRKLAE